MICQRCGQGVAEYEVSSDILKCFLVCFDCMLEARKLIDSKLAMTNMTIGKLSMKGSSMNE